MPLLFYGHPFSSYCWKVLIALDEGALPFEWRMLDGDAAWEELETLWPLRKMPVLVDGDQVLAEASIIIEHLALRFPVVATMFPADPEAVLRVRFLDRFFDQYIHTPTQKIAGDHLRPPAARDPHGVAEARTTLDRAYRWIDANAGEPWAAGADFTLADCAAAPALFYADWVHPIPDACAATQALRARLLARPSVARLIEEARPYRALFPPGAPDRD